LTPRSCIFCGARPLTREHVWPDWMRRKLATEETMHHTGLLEQHGEVSKILDFDDRPYKQTANAVCAGCNGGWMSRLEEGAKSYLDGMIEGRGRELHAGGQAELASWALLKAIIFDQASPKGAQALFPDLYSGLYGSAEPPGRGCKIWLGAYGGELPGFTAMTALAVATDNRPYTGERNVWVRTFSTGPVLFQVFTTSDAGLADYDPGWAELRDPPQVIQIWPTGPSVRWLPGPALNDDGLIWFANHVVSTLIQSSASHRE
jgi:hypothetical protein